MGLKPLDCSIYYDFCQNFFKQKGGNLSKDVFEQIYHQFNGHTWYIQCIMNRLYETELTIYCIEQVNAALLSILQGREPQFENLVQFFTEVAIEEDNGRAYLTALYKGKTHIKERLLPLDAERFQHCCPAYLRQVHQGAQAEWSQQRKGCPKSTRRQGIGI